MITVLLDACFYLSLVILDPYDYTLKVNILIFWIPFPSRFTSRFLWYLISTKKILGKQFQVDFVSTILEQISTHYYNSNLPKKWIFQSSIYVSLGKTNMATSELPKNFRLFVFGRTIRSPNHTLEPNNKTGTVKFSDEVTGGKLIRHFISIH